MAKWTEERRKKHAEAIQRWKPWEKSTGPKTTKGKARVGLNPLKHGLRSRSAQSIRQALKLNKAFIEHVMLYAETEAVRHIRRSSTNKLLKKPLKSIMDTRAPGKMNEQTIRSDE